jgi:hypothetical protein
MNTRRAPRAADGKEDTDMNMGRLYKLIYKGALDPEAKAQAKEEMLREILEIDNVRTAYFSEDPEGIVIFTADGEYTEVMNRVVNIVSRTVSNVSSKASADLSFVRFVEE